MRYLEANSLSLRLRAYTPFLHLVLVLYYPFKGGWCCCHPWPQEQSCSNRHNCRLDRPSSAVGGETTLFGGYTDPSSCGWYFPYLWAQQRQCSKQHYCRRDRPPILRSVGELLCLGVVLTLSSGWHMCNPRADASRFLYGWRRDPLLCYPPLHYRWGRCCLFLCG